MELFKREAVNNILPHDGIAHYYGEIFDAPKASYYLKKLLSGIVWKNDEAIIYGKRIITKRKVAWYGDKNFEYTYSNTSKFALEWTNELLEIKREIEKNAGITFNSCLLNLYHTGEEGMAWHSDSERSLGKNTTIASVSFGAERKFCFKHKLTKQTVPIMLNAGSLLIMKGTTQTYWLHSLPKSKRVLQPRINLTFRNIVTQ